MPAHSNSICILDDNVLVRNSIMQLLDSDGLQAESFEDTEVFFAHLNRNKVSLAVIDLWMPNMNGLEVQARLRKISPDTEVIVITGREIPGVRLAALEGGALAFLVKPFDDEVFLSLVRHALRISR